MNEDKLFNIYLHELIEWNNKFNLTSITDPEEIRKKHFEDSLLLLRSLELKQGSLVDIGAGAGFPGIPLKIICPNIHLTLVEATKKKTEFLAHLAARLGLKNVEVVWGRAEEVLSTRREQFDLAVARAVAELNTLAEYCLPFVKIGGLFVAYKELAIEPEIERAGASIKRLGGLVNRVDKYDSRSLVFIDKIAPTPADFPRRSGMAKKRPL
ncbi:MAG: 16S rRNA (guanine(527)-N(7))-methyltransferase RsmG [Candidatus Margulisbacteria bacterium]|nr:16S rRNA (guanine(527)-N(7))-methyltransferase RsmG [Candidatus Margulisiibacteriota bacterium]MBU1617733.1 16S rRNA (guanine(527)-N(7))-methyltransferase RsmG [Candidatus Margulisiibacteriota bacterium]MBU1867468.1 16S rRNA (guanine(527)-N(7))-methyltransferase RsmG [Candidatus Margulisiibacteriota bacterium]